ncbi:sulfatase [Sediminicola luteus]|uniref:sulfatase n=1 Tax=Sediminicola luteus TaxID=319238 RepID=UPI00114223EE|nr:sulfatase [Sediminicola luteus]
MKKIRTIPPERFRNISVLLCFLAFGYTFTLHAQTEKPNIILFLVDDMGSMDPGYMGNPFYETPNLDRMAQEGMRFTNAYANAPNCAPTRASIMTGLYTPRHGMYTVNSSARGKSENRKLIPIENTTSLAPTFTTMAEALKAQGYATHHIGKWHLGGTPTTLPQGQGFDNNIAGTHKGHPNTYFSPYQNPELTDGPEGEYLTDRLTDEALRIMESNDAQPFFLYFSHYAVHTPIQGKPDLVSKYGQKKGHSEWHSEYAAMVESMDTSLGRLLQYLRDTEQDRNTLVLFFSDNGGHGAYTKHKPLRGYKGSMFEGGFREPMVAWMPGTIPPQSASDEVVMGLDFFPTFIKMAGGNPNTYQLDGHDLSDLFKNPNTRLDREAVFWHFPAYLEAYRGSVRPEDLVRGWRAVPSAAIRKGQWKLIYDYETASAQLYDLDKDLGESQDLAQRHPEIVKELKKALRQWQKQVNAPIPSQLNPEYKLH